MYKPLVMTLVVSLSQAWHALLVIAYITRIYQVDLTGCELVKLHEELDHCRY